MVVQDDTKFKLYTLDLDEIDKYSGKLGQKPFKFEMIFEYEDTEVNCKALNQIHVRGDSKKLMADSNHKLFVFFVHGDCVYSWI